jgi:hypothetical protein
MYGEARDAGYESTLPAAVLMISVIDDEDGIPLLDQFGVELDVAVGDAREQDSGDVGWVIESDLPGRRPARLLYE